MVEPGSISDAQLSLALVAAAVSISVVVFGWGTGIVPSLKRFYFASFALIALSILFFGTSLFFGGQGIAYGPGLGPRNKFDLQAITLILGLVFTILAMLMISLGVSHSRKLNEQSNAESQRLLASIQVRLQRLEESLPKVSDLSPHEQSAEVVYDPVPEGRRDDIPDH